MKLKYKYKYYMKNGNSRLEMLTEICLWWSTKITLKTKLKKIIHNPNSGNVGTFFKFE